MAIQKSSPVFTNYHSHSHYCDGVEPPRAQVEGALQQNVGVFGFSSHGPVDFVNAWSMQAEKLADYLAETRALKSEFSDKIELYIGLEIDYLPGSCGPSTYASALDYTIGSVHYLDKNELGEPWEIDGSTEKFMRGLVEVHGGDIRKVIGLYYDRIREMLTLDPPDILGHLDKIIIHNLHNSLFDESDDWYQKEIDQTLDLLAETDCVLEVNTRGLYKKNLSTYPSMPIVAKALARNIPVMINSDSHAPAEITARLSDTALQLKQLGFKTLRILHNNAWRDVAFDGEGLYL
ncbi:histidinol-phosphatase [Persicitalea jodogahamensis]|uniref:Histidinol-phosphatase n=1 Tax=Persicitalea jodogahamensis TaxID=402147 RepID=A0A8J3D8D4_9BACT|nr:histidinol-phosphatase [Persicitalea jodogahamensis]GHB64886.1 histidinol-phosphatase [Persicitalea jodogahamensis]